MSKHFMLTELENIEATVRRECIEYGRGCARSVGEPADIKEARAKQTIRNVLQDIALSIGRLRAMMGEDYRIPLPASLRDVYPDLPTDYEALQSALTASEERVVELEEELRAVSVVDPTKIWYCGCGTYNGVNLAVCRICGRTEGESIADCRRSRKAPERTEEKL